METRNAYDRSDPSSQSNFEEVTIKHIALEWTIDFNTKTIHGKATLSFEILADYAKYVRLDTRDLSIESITCNNTMLSYTLDEPYLALGSRLSIPFPVIDANAKEFDIIITYSVSPEASAVQWLDADATADKEYPFVFTQSQAIHARSLFPCMDGPGVKHTYSAIITAPAWCTVLMSAVADEPPSISSTSSTHTWSQRTPVSAYLIALAAGSLASRDISHRVRIWAEPAVIEAAAFEFSETETFLSTAEDLTCPYVWQRYDVLCLPPSFPYGGMENPCLTFATPTLLAGDKSLASVIAHEIAHSWSGNLVTNHSWEHFWLNEGLTVWLERKIIGRVKGINAAKLSAEIGRQDVIADVRRMGDDSLYSRLVWVLEEGADPDDAFSSVPYEKGFNLLYYLESKVGSEIFEKFIQAYIERYKFSTVTTGDFIDFFMDKMGGLRSAQEVISHDFWEKMLYSTGFTAEYIENDFSNPLSAAATELASKIISQEYNSSMLLPFSSSELDDWSSQQKCILLDNLLETTKQSNKLNEQALQIIDRCFDLSEYKNSEVRYRWQMLCLACKAQFIIPFVIAFLTEQGRMKFVRPLYRALATVAPDVAKETFQKYSLSYHPIARKMIASDLAVASVVVTAEAISTNPESNQPVLRSKSGPRSLSMLAIGGGIAVAGLAFMLIYRARKT